MLRRGRYKVHLSHREAPQLYDLATDPGEFTDLARSAVHSEVLQDMTSRLMARWDSERLNGLVLESQDQRIATAARSASISNRPAI